MTNCFLSNFLVKIFKQLLLKLLYILMQYSHLRGVKFYEDRLLMFCFKNI